MPTTPNMNLILPSPTITPGPTYATQNNTAFEAVDSHDHTSGNGVQVPSAGIGIDADLPFNANNATELRSVRFENQASALAVATDIGCTYVAGGNLYFNDVSGTQIQLTAGGALNAASIGGIGGDYSTSTASVYYQDINDTYYFTSDVNKPATVSVGSAIIQEPTTSPNGVTIKSTTSLASSYDLTLPSALPASTRVVSLTSAGVLGTGVAGTIVTADLANSAVTTAKIADSNVTTVKIQDGAVTVAKLASLNSSTATIGAFTTSNTSYQSTGLATSAIAYTRGVYIYVFPNGTATLNGGTGGIDLAIDRSGVNVHTISYPAGVQNTAGFVFPYFSTGTYIFTIVAKSVDGSTVTFSNWGIAAVEI